MRSPVSAPSSPLGDKTRVTTFTLRPAAPFRLDLTVWALRRRPANTVDCWDGAAYRRVLFAGGAPIDVVVHQSGPPEAPSLEVDAVGIVGRSAQAAVAATVEGMLGLGMDLAGFYTMAETDALLGPLAGRFRGMHPPRLASLFEALVNAVSCQQLSLSVGIVLLNRLTATYGRPGADGAVRAFPQPDDLAGATPEELRKLGYSHRKGEVLVNLARRVGGGTLRLDDLAHLDDATAISRLCELDGIGRWSAEYVLLRGLGRLQVFPGDDVGARNKLSRWLSQPEPLDYRGVAGVVERWQPYAGLVYLHLLLDSLAVAGWASEEPPPLADGRHRR